MLERVVRGHSNDTLFIFGHARQGWNVTGSGANLLFQRNYFSALLDYVRAELKSGKPREEIVKSTAELKGFPEITVRSFPACSQQPATSWRPDSLGRRGRPRGVCRLLERRSSGNIRPLRSYMRRRC